ncbi:MAG: hypothetical protein WCP39_02915, partial [Chlamydiota bacterium]
MSQDTNEKKTLSSEDAIIAHYHLSKGLLFFLKQLSKCEFYYWKGAGLFFLLSILLLVFKNYFFATNPFFGTFLLGICFLLLLAQNMRLDFTYRMQAASCIEHGVSLEKTYKVGTLFSAFNDNKLLSCQCNAISRLFPLG